MADAYLPLAPAPAPGVRDGQITISQLVDAYMAVYSGRDDSRAQRLGYWVARFARDAGPALVPDVPGLPVQVLDVRDLATFIVDAALRGVTGVMNVAGTPVPFADALATSADAAGHDGSTRPASADWLAEHDVQHWMGPRSLPLWIPDDALGMVAMDTSRASAAGLTRRPLAKTLADTLEDEKHRGLARDRRAAFAPVTSFFPEDCTCRIARWITR